MAVLLDKIPFTSPEADRVRTILREAGCGTDDDIVKLGCTGLYGALKVGWTTEEGFRLARDAVAFVRSNMGGSGCGLPCYVPPTRFCNIHNTIGGLQQGQAARGLIDNVCSRPLTPEEALHAAAVTAAINQEGAKEAKRCFGLEAVEGEVESASSPVGPVDAPEASSLLVCPDHVVLDWKCRYCLAAAILGGTSEPEVRVYLGDSKQFTSIDYIAAELAEGTEARIEIHAIVARWERKLVRSFCRSF